MKDSLTIGIAGVGGDGVVVLGCLLQRLVAAWQGYFCQMPRYYGAQNRDGGSIEKLGINATYLSLLKDSLDIFI
jgi:Pyruvate/2-oxoacid:ferredoxin oxidoreductase gamma subunit